MAKELPTVSEPERTERCETCRWWNSRFDEPSCQRMPPTVLNNPIHLGGKTSVWPTTEPDDWCGKWQAK